MYKSTEMLEVRFLRQKRKKTVLRRQKLFLYFPLLVSCFFFEDEVLVALTLKTKKFHVLFHKDILFHLHLQVFIGRVAAVSFNTKVLITIGSSPPAPVLDLYLLTFFKNEASRD
jgi:hypothetical protein